MTDHHITTLAAVHEELCSRAAELANRDPRLRRWTDDATNVFRSASAASARPGGGLSLEFDEAYLADPKLAPYRDQFIRDMNEIALDAVRQALVDRSDLFAGAILGEARAGRNYFAPRTGRHSVPPDQLSFGL